MIQLQPIGLAAEGHVRHAPISAPSPLATPGSKDLLKSLTFTCDATQRTTFHTFTSKVDERKSQITFNRTQRALPWQQD